MVTLKYIRKLYITQMELLGHSFFVFKNVDTNKINVVYKRNDGDYGVGKSSNPNYRYADSTTLELKEPTGTGRTFDGWYTDSTFTTRVTKLPQGNTEDIVLVGKWLGREITIIYELYGGTMGDSTNPEKVLNGEKIRFKNPTREGYVFKGWNYPVEGHTYLNSTFTAYSAKYDTIYIYAEWTLEPIKPSVDSSGCYLVTNAHEWYYFNPFTEVYLGEKPPTDACIKIMEDFAVNEDLSELEPNHSTYGYVAWTRLDFTGTVYGNGHTISGLVMNYYSEKNDSYNGLFWDGMPDGKNPADYPGTFEADSLAQVRHQRPQHEKTPQLRRVLLTKHPRHLNVEGDNLKVCAMRE